MVDKTNNQDEKHARLPSILGYLSEAESYDMLFSINKASSEANIWPIQNPLPVYVKDAQGNGFVIYSAIMVAPSTDLPSLSVIDGKKIYTIDPAKNFILESGLTTLTARGVVMNRQIIPRPMTSISLMIDGEIQDAWKKDGFTHLKLVANALQKDHFLMFMQEFATRFATVIKGDQELRHAMLKILTEIGRGSGLFEDTDYMVVMRKFLADDSCAMLLEQKTANIKTILRDTSVKYGDLITFKVREGVYLMIVENIDSLATLQPLVAMLDGKTRMSFHPLEHGTEGSVEDVESIIESLYNEAGGDAFKIPVGKIPNVEEQPYSILLKGNTLIHFAIIAISGRGKGNFNKKFLLEIMRQQAEYLEAHNGNQANFKGVSAILFDDVGEYVKCMKPGDWGLNVAALALYYSHGHVPLLHLVDISIEAKVEKESDALEGELWDCITPTPAKIPIEYITLDEISRSLKGLVAYDVIPAAMRIYYTDHPGDKPENSEESRLSIPFVNWFLDDGDPDKPKNSLSKHGFKDGSIIAARRALRTFMFTNGKYMGIKYDGNAGTFDYMDVFKDEKTGTLSKACNLLELAWDCAEKGKILVLDESDLGKRTKLLVQRITLDYILSKREAQGYDNDQNPCLFIIEEATALMRESGSGQLDLFAEVAVKARKFGIGIGLVFQNVDKVDPILLQQLGWTVIMGLPVDAMRSNLSRNVPSDIDAYDIYVKRADIGVAIGIQQKLGGSVTLPFTVDHYERDVSKILSELEEDDFTIVKKAIAGAGVPLDVMNNIERMRDNIKEEAGGKE